MGRRNPKWSMHGKGVTKKEDTWFSRAIRQRDNWACRNPTCCNNRETGHQMDCAHIQSRRHLSTRWHPLNAICLCRQCHGYFEDRPTEFTFMLLEIGYTIEELDYLQQLSHQPFKAPDSIRQSISDHFRVDFNRMVKAGTHDLQPWGEANEHDEAPLQRAY